MNKQQISAWLGITFASGGPIAALIIAKTGLSIGEYQLYMEAALSILPGAIAAFADWYRNRESSQIRRVSNLDCVSKVVVKDGAPDHASALVADPTAPKVVSEKEIVK